jgi:hypothetical protein
MLTAASSMTAMSSAMELLLSKKYLHERERERERERARVCESKCCLLHTVRD